MHIGACRRNFSNRGERLYPDDFEMDWTRIPLQVAVGARLPLIATPHGNSCCFPGSTC
jgi:hypothetical protein